MWIIIINGGAGWSVGEVLGPLNKKKKGCAGLAARGILGDVTNIWAKSL